MNRLKFIFDQIAADSFAESTLLEINNYINDIQNGTEDFPRFNLSEHAGLCTAGAPLIGAAIVASYAAASLTASGHAGGGQGSGPANWEIDERQEQLIEQWAKTANLWVEDSEQILTEELGPKIAQGAEAKVYYREGDTSVVKERASIYSATTGTDKGVNYISDRLALEDMHPANVFIDRITARPICIDCIVKFVKAPGADQI